MNTTTEEINKQNFHSHKATRNENEVRFEELAETIQYFEEVLKAKKNNGYMEFELFVDGIRMLGKTSDTNKLKSVIYLVKKKITKFIEIKVYRTNGQQNADSVIIKIKNEDAAQENPLQGFGGFGIDGLGSVDIKTAIEKHTEIALEKDRLARLEAENSELKAEVNRLESELDKAMVDVDKYSDECESLTKENNTLKTNNNMQLLSGIASLADGLGVLDKFGLKPKVPLGSINAGGLSEYDAQLLNWAKEIESTFSENMDAFNTLIEILKQDIGLVDKIVGQWQN